MQVRFGSDTNELIEVYVQDFGDNYHRFDDEPSSELEKEVRKIRRRYKDVSDYIKALAAYEEYMGLLVEKYGGPDVFKLKLKYNQVTDFVPPKPGIKPNEINKFSLKNKIIISKRRSYVLNEEILNEIENSYAADNKKEEDDGPKVLSKSKFDKKERKMVKKILKKGEINSLVRGRKSIKKDIPSIQYLEEYFYTKNRGGYGKSKDEEPVFSLSEYYDGSFAKKLRDTRNEERETVFFRGNYIDRESADELALYKQLGKIGWNSMKIMREAGVSKKITKALKKEGKKNKKKEKKKRKHDNLVVQLMTDGGYDSFEDFQAEMESFKVSDIFGD